MSNNNKEDLIKKLEDLAKKVLEYKKEHNQQTQRRPIIIEFCGSPKSGKTTTINSLNTFLKRNDFKTIVLSERASVCPVKDKKDPFFNIWTLTSAIAELIGYLESKDKYDVIIADRGIFDSLCWFEWLNHENDGNNSSLDNETYNILENFALIDLWRNIIDIVYIFKVPPSTSIQREYANLLTKKPGSIMREDTLSNFNKAIDRAKKKYSKYFRCVKQIDTSEQKNDQNQVGYDVTLNILEALKGLFIEKIGYFESSIKDELVHGINSVKILSNKEIKFKDRSIIENSDYIQPLPIAVITNKEKSKVLVVKKNKERTSKESPERDKLLLYLGGHLREEDDIDKNLNKTINKGLHRELREELGRSISVNSDDSFLIYTPTTDKSKKHLAICHVVTLDLENEKFNPSKEEFISKKGKSESGQVLEISKLKNKKPEDMEDWSREILKEVFYVKPNPRIFD